MIIAVLMGCSKSKDVYPKTELSLTGTKWEAFWFTASGGEKFYHRLHFKSNTKVDYYQTYINDTFLTGYGKSELSYTIDDPNKEFPKIRVYGTLNSFAGVAMAGDNVDYILSYTPELGSTKASLSMKDRYYMKF